MSSSGPKGRYRGLFLLLAGLTVAIILSTGCGHDLQIDSAFLRADVTRGGLLYDKWWKVTGAAEPTSTHPLYPNEAAKSGSTTWRCKECHGWDYRGAAGAYSSGSHYTGIQGVWQASAKSADLIYKDLAGGIAAHDLRTWMGEDDIWDLVRFLKEGVIDAPQYINLSTKSFIGADADAGGTIYNANCAPCHGADGAAIEFDDGVFMGNIANDNPWEFLHKARMGQPNTAMPALFDIPGTTLQDAINVGAYAQTLIPSEAGGSVTRGGRLYDKWWTTAGVPEPTGDHPLYPAEGTKTGSTTWRCKECHGWDYQGAAGAYGSGSHYTGIAGIWEATTESRETLFETLSGGIAGHDFGQYMADDDLWDLVEFMKEGTAFIPTYIDLASKTFNNANAGAGMNTYNSYCAVCHGTDGTAIVFGDEEYVDDIASGNPWEFLHKVRMGQPGTAMTALYDLPGSTIQDAVNLGAYSQTLEPTVVQGDVARGGRLYDKWWKEAGVAEPTTTHPLYPAEGAQSGSGTWRCKECHGWDYLGAAGAYGSGSHFTGISGVYASSGYSDGTLLGILSGDLANHDFGDLLSDTDLADLVAFLKDGVVDIPAYIDQGTKTFKNADTDNGGALYTPKCAPCHGANGQQIDFGDGTFVADIATGNPWEFLHKARMGQPATSMPPLFNDPLLDTQDAADVGAYCQTLQ